MSLRPLIVQGSSMIWKGGGGVLCQLWCRVVSVMCAARPSTCLTITKSCLTTVFERHIGFGALYRVTDDLIISRSSILSDITV